MCFGKTSKWGIGTCLGCDIGGWLMKKGGGAKDKEEVRAREKPRRNKDQDRIRREGAPETSGGETEGQAGRGGDTMEGFNDDLSDGRGAVPGTSVGYPASPTRPQEAVEAEEKKVVLPGTTTARSAASAASSEGEGGSSGGGDDGDALPVLPEGEPPEQSTSTPVPVPPPVPPPDDDNDGSAVTGAAEAPATATEDGKEGGATAGAPAEGERPTSRGGKGVSFSSDIAAESSDANEFDVFDEEPEENDLARIENLSAKDLTKLASLKSFKSFKGKKGLKRKVVWLNPKGAVRARWDAVVVTCILYNSIVLPLRITFGSADDLADPLSIIDFFIDTLFIVDIFLNFNTGFDDDGTVVMDAQIVRFHYFRTFFVIDLIASLPFDLLVFCFPDTHGDTRLYLRLPRLLRLLRLPRMFRYLNRWEDILPINAVALRMFKLLFSVLMFAHMNACMQMLAAELQDFPMNSWATRAGVVHQSAVTKYTHAAFRALSHMLCIGYGQEPPYTIIEYWLVIFSMMLGAMFYALLLGMMPTLMLSMDISGSLYTQKVDIWRQYFNYRGITKDLRKRILSYFEFRWHTRKVFSEEELLGELSTCLQTDIQMHVCEELIRKAPIFHALQPHVVTAVVSFLVPVKISESEYVYNEGDISDSMYFIQSGEVSIESSEGTAFTTLSDGSYFGEFSFLYSDNRTRTACAKASKPTELFMLSQENFAVLTQAFPELLELLLNIADARTAIFMKQKEERDEMEMAGLRYRDPHGLSSSSSNNFDLDGRDHDFASKSNGGVGDKAGRGSGLQQTKESSNNEAMAVIDKIKKKGLLSHITLNPGGEQAKLSMASTFAASQRLNQLQRSDTMERTRRSMNSKRKSKIVNKNNNFDM